MTPTGNSGKGYSQDDSDTADLESNSFQIV